MSEFQDFLKRKFAYVAVGEFKPGKFQEAEQLYEKAISTYTHGFQGSYLLQEPGTDRAIAIIFWESVEDMESNKSETYQSILEQMAPLFAHPPTTGLYELVNEIHPNKVEE